MTTDYKFSQLNRSYDTKMESPPEPKEIGCSGCLIGYKYEVQYLDCPNCEHSGPIDQFRKNKDARFQFYDVVYCSECECNIELEE